MINHSLIDTEIYFRYSAKKKSIVQNRGATTLGGLLSWSDLGLSVVSVAMTQHRVILLAVVFLFRVYTTPSWITRTFQNPTRSNFLREKIYFYGFCGDIHLKKWHCRAVHFEFIVDKRLEIDL